MRRLATLLVVAVAAVGCTKGGEVGPEGPAGAAGVAGVLQTFTPVIANQSATVTFTGTTYICKTPTFVAGANQAAIVSAYASCAALPSGVGIAVNAGYNDGVSDLRVPGYFLYNTNGSATAQYMGASNTGYITLNQGTSYQFEAALIFYPSQAAGSTCFCNVVAQIVGR